MKIPERLAYGCYKHGMLAGVLGFMKKMESYTGVGCRFTDLEGGKVLFESNSSAGAMEALKLYLGEGPWVSKEVADMTTEIRNGKGVGVLVEDYAEIVRPSEVFLYQG